jgi:hypothetical protein
MQSQWTPWLLSKIFSLFFSFIKKNRTKVIDNFFLSIGCGHKINTIQQGWVIDIDQFSKRIC